MPGTVVTFWEWPIIPNYDATATFQAQVHFEDSSMWWVDRIDLAKSERSASRLPIFEPLDEMNGVCIALRDLLNHDQKARAEVRAQIRHDLADEYADSDAVELVG